ncbi:MAG: hypothetical protein GKR87_09675 [Kiritimatiellae bacterium]|nr:hypothetical protein [Kiritimatiellia bacterium]
MELAEKKVPFETLLSLPEGSNQVTIIATDLKGAHATKTMLLAVDLHPPDLLIEKVEKQGNQWIIDGRCIDNFALASIKYGTVFDQWSKGTSQPVHLEIYPQQPLFFEAKDQAGSLFKTTFSANDLEQRYAERGRPYQFASNPIQGVIDSPPPRLPKPPKEALLSQDHIKPNLDLNISSVMSTFDEEVDMHGRASDANGLGSIILNGQEILKKKGLSSSASRKGSL